MSEDRATVEKEQPVEAAQPPPPPMPAPTGTTQEEVTKIMLGAKAEGSISAADLAEKLAVLDITTDDTDAVYQRLVEMGVDIVEDEAILEEEEEEEEPAPDADEERARARREVEMALKAPTNDPVRMYLKEIGRVSLLTAQEEVSLAKRIEAGVFATEELADPAAKLTEARVNELRWLEFDGDRAKRHLVEAN
ncbi:MAG TPA: sigma-70 factor domain-containing protein, partial [Actinomycetota bacterium]